MQRLLVLAMLCSTLVLGACSESQSPSEPSDGSEAGALANVQSGSGGLDLASETDASTEGTGTISVGSADAATEAVTCQQIGSHRVCLTHRPRNGGLLIQQVDARGRLRFQTCTRGQAFLNGLRYSQTNAVCGFAGNVIFATHPRDVQTFRGDRVCHRWTSGISARDVCFNIV
ncbi:MAG: hypothetical protein H0V09_10960 [Gemmatimonadetes bacterium]|nr:hypothetical protein [Gemmatimonadota bacterium]